MSAGRPAVFLDRDGTLMEEVGYCSDPANVAIYPGVREALARLRDAGFALIVITNQSGIGLGIFHGVGLPRGDAEVHSAGGAGADRWRLFQSGHSGQWIAAAEARAGDGA